MDLVLDKVNATKLMFLLLDGNVLNSTASLKDVIFSTANLKSISIPLKFHGKYTILFPFSNITTHRISYFNWI